MIKFLLGVVLICGGFYKTLFVDPVWGLYLFAAFTHIRLVQLSENIPLPLNIPIIIASLTLILYLMGQQYKQKLNHWPMEAWLMGLMVVGMAISSSRAEFASAESWHFTSTFLKYWIFFVMMINMIDSFKKIEWFHRTLILSAVWLVYRCWDLRGTTGARFENTGGDIISDANHYAATLILLFPFVFQKTLSHKKWITIGATTVCFGIVMAIFISGSRGGLLGLAILFVLTVFNFKEYLNKTIILLMLILFSVAPFINDFHKDRLSQLFTARLEETRDASSQQRIDNWKLALQLFNEHKFLGVGPGNFKYYSGYLLEGLPHGEPGHVTHSLWMEVLSEGGLLVTTPFLLMLYRFFRGTKKTIHIMQQANGHNNPGHNNPIPYIICIRVSLASFLVCATFLNRLMYEPIYWCIGLGVVHLFLFNEQIFPNRQ